MTIIEVIKSASQYVDECSTTDTIRSISVYIGNHTNGFYVSRDGNVTGNLSLYRDFLQQAIEGLILHYKIKQLVLGEGFWIKFLCGRQLYAEWFGVSLSASHKLDAIKFILEAFS